ncbi:MAG: hypothetical protein LBE46_03655 [Wolbachia pipientis]|nr:hypothetical protein [Wolbachia pipientis]
MSCENGFHNSKFTLKEDLISKRSDTRYFDSMSSITEATESITEFYNKKKEEEKNAITHNVQKKIERENKSK